MPTATTANARLAEEADDHAVDVIRFERGVVLRMIAVLNRADARLMAQLSEALLQIEAGSFTVERLEALLTSVRFQLSNAEAYRDTFAALEPEIRAAAQAEAAGHVQGEHACGHALERKEHFRPREAGQRWEFHGGPGLFAFMASCSSAVRCPA